MSVIPINGAVHYTIILDPSVWIFDNRKLKLDEYLNDGSVINVKEREATDSYAIPLEPFLKNAQPTADATGVILHKSNGVQISITLDEALSGILAFALEGKPIKETGPVHFYHGHGHHTIEPITHITRFEVI